MAAAEETLSPAPSGAGAWGELLRAPGVPRVVTAALIARLPLGMHALGVVLLVRGQGGSYATAGLLAAGSSLASAASGPALGRLIDRLGQTRVLLPLALLYPTAVVGLVAAVLAGAPLALLIAVAVAVGLVQPPIPAAIRALWPSMLPRAELRGTAYAMEASLQELFFVAGPLLVAVIVAAASPAAALGVSAAAAGLGTLAFATSPPARRAGAQPGVFEPRRRGGALASAGVRTVALTSLSMGAAFGAIEVSMPAFAEAHGSRAAGGVALAAYAAGSLLGGLWVGSRPATARPIRRYALAVGAFAAGLVLPLLAGSIPAMTLALLVAGVPIAPAFAAAYGLVDALAVPGTATEAFAWLSTSIILGLAGGTAAAGALIETAGGTDASLAMGLAAGLLGLACVAVGRRTLRPG
ncbi:MAG TPA: MFS transporter [Solirubrobacteraceae bacterium]|jgi:predicted MFS family arabinose efflux permease